MAQPHSHTNKDARTQKFDLNEDVPSRESLIGDDERSPSWSAASDSSHTKASTQSSSMDSKMDSSMDSSTKSERFSDDQQNGDALQTLRASVVGVLDSVVREYEPQINEFTSNVAHQIVDRGVDFAQTAVDRVRRQSWARLGLAAAFGVGLIAILSYEAEKGAASAPRARRTTH